MKYKLPRLPIHAVLPRLQGNLASHTGTVLAAEPGSGKTTIVPLALLNEPWLTNKKIIMLEPRRLAARMSAKRLSELAGDKLGGLVGYRIRFDKKISSKTRIEVVTEGILTRMLQRDPELSEVGLVVFDEFHERSIHADLALALCLDVQNIREDLKILIMSATMDTARVAKLLGDAPVITGHGRCFPVSINYLPQSAVGSLIQRTIKVIYQALADHNGDILVFLPGAGAIRAVQNRISGDFLCLPLYGNLPQKQQDLVFAPTARRRLILATPIAETSLTIEGVSIIIDSGLMKTPRFSPATGLTALHTIPISKASAKQRAGRAGRLGPGTCYRLWTEAEHHSKAEFLPPEIIGADLAPLLLEVLLWGVPGPEALAWLDQPRPGQVKQARETLAKLGAITPKGTLTKVGRRISALPLHPRLALMLLRGHEQGKGPLACRLAALLQNRDLFRLDNGQRSVDIEDRLEILRLFEQGGSSLVQARGADPSLCRRILQETKQYQRLLGIHGKADSFQDSGTLLVLAFPDRIARKKPGSSQHLLSSGRGVILPIGDHLQKADFLVAANVDGGKKQGRIFLGAAITREEIIENHAHLLREKDCVVWNKDRVEAMSILSIGSLELARKPLTEADPHRVSQCLVEGIKELGIECLGWQKSSRELQTRMQAAHDWAPNRWPDVSDIQLAKDFSWLEPYLNSITTLKQLKRLDLTAILRAFLSWHDQQELDRLVPSHFQVPSGSRIKLLYSPGEPPVLAVRLQEMFGSTTGVHIFGGKVAVLIHLLSPAGRPIQVTSDLAGFWQNTYGEVKKELKGRYPKHFWPDDPLTAKATNRVKAR